MERDGNEPFDVRIQTVGPDARTRAFAHTVVSVAFGSFADQCGLQEGDIIVNVGGRDASAVDGHALWDTLDALGARFELVVDRKVLLR